MYVRRKVENRSRDRDTREKRCHMKILLDEQYTTVAKYSMAGHFNP